MSILIKGMEMPKDEFVDIRINSKGIALSVTKEEPCLKAYEVVEVPEPHGRLIDADNGIDEDVKDYEFNGKYAGCTIQDMLDSAPTVIEAEKWGR